VIQKYIGETVKSLNLNTTDITIIFNHTNIFKKTISPQTPFLELFSQPIASCGLFFQKKSIPRDLLSSDSVLGANFLTLFLSTVFPKKVFFPRVCLTSNSIPGCIFPVISIPQPRIFTGIFKFALLFPKPQNPLAESLISPSAFLGSFSEDICPGLTDSLCDLSTGRQNTAGQSLQQQFSRVDFHMNIKTGF
jgi:hypothetical protein